MDAVRWFPPVLLFAPYSGSPPAQPRRATLAGPPTGGPVLLTPVRTAAMDALALEALAAKQPMGGHCVQCTGVGDSGGIAGQTGSGGSETFPSPTGG